MPIPAGRPPFRADHVGSLLRPAALKDAFRRRQAGEIGADAFREIEDDAIRAAVRLQEDVGLEVVTDGEFRRGSYWGRFVDRLDGLEVRPAAFRFHDGHGRESEFTAPFAVDRVCRQRPLAVDELAFLRRVARATPKITLPSPSAMHFYRCGDYAAPGVYDDAGHFFADLAAAYRDEIAALAAAGCRYVQFDEVAIAMLCDPAIRRQVAAAGHDPDGLVDLYIDAINSCIRDRPSEMVIGVHICRGNFKGLHLSEGGYESVADRFFGRADADHFLLEYDTPRAGDFSPLRFVPDDKGVVLGLVSTKRPEIEEVAVLKRRVEEATQFIDLERLAVGPQCGFASTVAGNPVTEEIERAKLRRLVETARAIWT